MREQLWKDCVYMRYESWVERQVREALFTDAAREIGARDLAQSRAILKAGYLT